ncbi:hypothetical protein NDU88_008467 [Pleurodeles waltl]|uniref:Uncharacterized protein n=1 Tax=Pleurodeles waltl TaxID=8319 RepID=A0AAV7PPJ5_PLEWA|nr:hypothetical protein NDU88_008467 [Pleurodeles waltl]
MEMVYQTPDDTLDVFDDEHAQKELEQEKAFSIQGSDSDIQSDMESQPLQSVQTAYDIRAPCVWERVWASLAGPVIARDLVLMQQAQTNVTPW